MLRERGGPIRDSQGRIRRRFTDGEFELRVFLEPDGSMFGFQLLYPQGSQLWLLSWSPVEQYLHFMVDSLAGAFEDVQGDHRRLPTDPGEVDGFALLERLRPATAALEPRLRSFVLELIFSLGDEVRRCRYCAPRPASAWHCPRCWLRACEACMERKSLRQSRCTWTEASHAWEPEPALLAASASEPRPSRPAP